MGLNDSQIEKLIKPKKTIKEDGNSKQFKQSMSASEITYSDVISYLESKPQHVIYDRLNFITLKIEGYLLMKNNAICPLVFNHSYMLRSLHLKNEELILSDRKVGYIFTQGGDLDSNRQERVSLSVWNYNKKIDKAISVFPRSKHLFEPRTIVGFKIL